jgi:hypothetical protein
MAQPWSAALPFFVALCASAALPPPAQTRPDWTLDLCGDWSVRPARLLDVPPSETAGAWGVLRVPGQADSIAPGRGGVWDSAGRRGMPALWSQRAVTYLRAHVEAEREEERRLLFYAWLPQP